MPSSPNEFTRQSIRASLIWMRIGSGLVFGFCILTVLGFISGALPFQDHRDIFMAKSTAACMAICSLTVFTISLILERLANVIIDHCNCSK